MDKKIYFYDFGSHTYLKNLIKNPPKGYAFIIQNGENKLYLFNKLKQNKLLVLLYKNLIKLVNPLKLLNKIYSKKSPEDSDIVFSSQLVYEKKHFIIELLDTPLSLAGYNYKIFMGHLKQIDRILSSPLCRKIIIHTKDCENQFKKYFSKMAVSKLVFLPPGIPKQKFFTRDYSHKNGTINFLFMGSINNPDDFFIKGGLEALEAFKILSENHPNITLTVKCKVPIDIKKKFSLRNITYIDYNISPEEIRKLYLNSDILLLPGHTFFLMAFLESMSFGLPIITLNTYAVSDFIEDGKNGFIINKSSRNNYYHEESYPTNVRDNNFLNRIKRVDSEVINHICEKAALLIENRKLLKKMSENSLKLANTKFSLKRRNKRLKQIFDKALENEGTIN